MKIALFGYGKMGQSIEKTAVERGHSITAKIDENNNFELLKLNPDNVDVAIEFSTPETAAENIKSCIDLGIPIISGTTGWNDRLQEIIEFCQQKEGTFFYA
jgi:4-hydroxy-tetrahydrodipicolinate reductase